jgi:hypothetical protein
LVLDPNESRVIILRLRLTEGILKDAIEGDDDMADNNDDVDDDTGNGLQFKSKCMFEHDFDGICDMSSSPAFLPCST